MDIIRMDLWGEFSVKVLGGETGGNETAGGTYAKCEHSISMDLWGEGSL